jgi:8-oxo-dGTP pyrophosphatase MutT (NUDIX family)
MPASKISIDNAKKDKLFNFLANVVVYRESDGRCLVLQRGFHEKAHPGRFGVIGGKLEWKDFPVDKPKRVNGDILDYTDVVEDLIARELKEEAGIDIYPEIKYINSVGYIRPDETPAVLVKFAARYKGGEVKIEEGAFETYQWVNAEEAKKLDCIDGIVDEIAQTIALFSK